MPRIDLCPLVGGPRSDFSDDSSNFAPPSSPLEVALAARVQRVAATLVQLKALPPEALGKHKARSLTPTNVSWRTATPLPLFGSSSTAGSPNKHTDDSVKGLEMAVAATRAVLVKRGYYPYPKPTPISPKATSVVITKEPGDQADNLVAGPYRAKKRELRKASKSAGPCPVATGATDGNADEVATQPAKLPRRQFRKPKPMIPLACLATLLSRRRGKASKA